MPNPAHTIPYICYHIRTGGRSASSPNIEIGALVIRLNLRTHSSPGKRLEDWLNIEPFCYHARIQFDEAKADMSGLNRTYNRQQWIETGVSQAVAVAGFASFASGYKSIAQPVGNTGNRISLPVSIVNNQSIQVPRLKAACAMAGVQYPLAHAVVDVMQLVTLDTVLAMAVMSSSGLPVMVNTTPIHLTKYAKAIDSLFDVSFDQELKMLGTPDPKDPRQLPDIASPDSVFYEIIYTAMVAAYILNGRWNLTGAAHGQ